MTGWSKWRRRAFTAGMLAYAISMFAMAARNMTWDEALSAVPEVLRIFGIAFAGLGLTAFIGLAGAMIVDRWRSSHPTDWGADA